MQPQRLAPGVQRGDHAGLRPQIFRIPEQLHERLVDAGKQQLGHHGDVGQPQGVELMRHGEDDMVVLARQEPHLLAGQPALDLDPSARRTHPVPTGVVPHSLHMPVRAGLDMTTQLRRPTRQDGPDRTPYMIGQCLTALIRRITPLQDRLRRDLVGSQGLSITTHASLHRFFRTHTLPLVRVRPTIDYMEIFLPNLPDDPLLDVHLISP